MTELDTIALIAHDRKKEEMIKFATKHKNFLSKFRLIATGTTGSKIHESAGLTVICKKSGPLGGDIEIASEVVNDNEINVLAVIFLVDPLFAQPHEPDIKALIRICELYDIPFATNLASAEAIIHWLKDKNSYTSHPSLQRKTSVPSEHFSKQQQNIF
ncbi:methylglyoxal synthase [Reticulomyxa filosa]|uniref:Methylglyoxal synthase n=1 Tax=Reticulomyxa filosa TaxID=46433 RepID=X6P3G7_RETFI|nr:methylglyoxal synthase [Reticulomyxa filosa]|eukprot:ETO32751.1 methylglyoxal synthase [Reticulomyxa filosa]